MPTSSWGVLLVKALPSEKLDLVECLARLVEEQHEPQAIGQIGVTGKIYSWIGHGRYANATYKTKARYGPGHDQVLH